jgi:hypothetical protein
LPEEPWLLLLERFLPFRLDDFREELGDVLWTLFKRSFGSSEARVFASSTTSFAWRVTTSLLAKA